MFKKGQRVLVWSLQSFHGGGFLEGEPAFISQDETGAGDRSVILTVIRKGSGGNLFIDTSYEVYPKQVEFVEKEDWPAKNELKRLREAVLGEQQIKCPHCRNIFVP